MTLIHSISRSISLSRSSSSSYVFDVEKYSSVKSQIEALCDEDTFKSLSFIGDCPGEISLKTKIEPGATFNLKAPNSTNRTLTIIDSTIGPQAQIYCGSTIEKSHVKGLMYGGRLHCSTLHTNGIMYRGEVTDSHVYGQVQGGILKRSILSKGESLYTHDVVRNKIIGQRLNPSNLIRKSMTNLKVAASALVHLTVTRHLEDFSE